MGFMIFANQCVLFLLYCIHCPIFFILSKTFTDFKTYLLSTNLSNNINNNVNKWYAPFVNTHIQHVYFAVKVTVMPKM